MRARARRLLFTFEQELFTHIEALEKNLKVAEKARLHVRDRLTELAPVFNKQKFMLGDEFSMLDVAIRAAAVAPRSLRHRTAEDRHCRSRSTPSASSAGRASSTP
ncbi:MAG: hypothetical protein M5R42_08820 [Rhodocyclaceae bacterium]|nr:hypothetical protein [Rhodocyclaceae bacterium]